MRRIILNHRLSCYYKLNVNGKDKDKAVKKCLLLK